jgi:hypothetical protein
MDKDDPELWTKLHHLASVLMMSGHYQEIAVQPHPVKDSIVFQVQLDDWNVRAAMLPAWRIKALPELQVLELLKDQLANKWKRT